MYIHHSLHFPIVGYCLMIIVVTVVQGISIYLIKNRYVHIKNEMVVNIKNKFKTYLLSQKTHFKNPNEKLIKK